MFDADRTFDRIRDVVARCHFPLCARPHRADRGSNHGHQYHSCAKRRSHDTTFSLEARPGTDSAQRLFTRPESAGDGFAFCGL
jgi:hypothetical protein